MNDSQNRPLSATDIDDRFAELDAEKRALLLERLAEAHKRLAVQAPRVATRIAPVPRGASLPLSFAQQRLWLLDRLLPNKTAYNIPAAWRLLGPLDVSALQRSLDAMVARHETLRTRFALGASEPVQLIDAAQPVPLPFTDLTALAPVEREVRARHLAREHARAPFDLERGPLLCAKLLRLAAEEHMLLLNVHHIAWDGWSVGVFDRELGAVYAALVNGREPALPALPIQYADYAVWQREWLKHEVLEQQLAYWKNRLADLPTLSLPTDRSRPPVASYRGGRVTRDLAAPLGAAVKALALREGATLFMTLLAAFQVLLARHSGQTDIAVGSPIAGRVRPELEGLIGFFVNTLVLRSDLSGNPRFRELLAQVRDNALGAYAHQDLPFEKLVEELAPVRDPSREPLFQVMLVLQNAPSPPRVLEGLEVSRITPERESAKFDLSVSVREAGQQLHMNFEYATDLFDRSTIERMAGRFEVLLESIVADAGQRLSELALITAAEREQLLVAWNATASDFPRDGCIQQRFEMQAARTPEAVAVVMGDRQLSYAELNTHANRLAHQLIALGVGAEVPVAICAERSLELVVGLLGILKAGGAYVPLDPGYPRARLAFMLQDTQAPVLLTQAALLDQLPPYAGRIVCLDRDAPSLAAQPATDPPCRSTAESLAYVIYTSGSTGRPKGVAVPHRAVLRLLSGDYVRFDAQQRFLLLSPISFDASVFELWGALLHGARCAIFPERVPTSTALGDALARHQVSTLWLTASLFNLIIDEAPQTLAGVRQLLTGGEALSPAHVRAALEQLPGVQLINGYGPTEGATFTCCYAIPSRLDPARASVPIGRPIGNTRVYVLDETLSPVPIGVAGELCIAGDGLARGYLNQPELSAQKFVPDPFSTIAGARLYRTGDRVRYLPDGNLEFLGRFDDQVKIRGFRIEPGEIETVLAEHASVRQAVVLAREDTPGEKRLVAYVLAATGGLDIDALRDFVAERLPDHMRPASYVRLDHLPITPAGKVDRHALAHLPQSGASPPARRSELPRDSVERTLCAIWSEVLGVQDVRIDDNFFELGGHSLRAAQLFARLDLAFGRSLSLSTLFHAPTVRQLAAFYRSDAEPAQIAMLVPIITSGSLPPVFGVAPGDGDILPFKALAENLGPGQPFFGLQYSGIDGADEPVESAGQMAAQFLREVRRVQPTGPYHLLGVCFGAIVTFEMARQLLAAGEEVAFVGLLDPSPMRPDAPDAFAPRLPASVKRGIAVCSFLAGRLRLYRDTMKRLGFRQRATFLYDKLRVVGAILVRRDLFRDGRREFNTFRVHESNRRALLRYRPEPLGGPARVEIFATAWHDEHVMQKARSQWSVLTSGQVHFHRAPGENTIDILRNDGVIAMASLLATRLRAPPD